MVSLNAAEPYKAYEGVEVKLHAFLTPPSLSVPVSCKPTERDD